jgi:hypothetical protein
MYILRCDATKVGAYGLGLDQDAAEKRMGNPDRPDAAEFAIGFVTGGMLAELAVAKSEVAVKVAHEWLMNAEAAVKRKGKRSSCRSYRS